MVKTSVGFAFRLDNRIGDMVLLGTGSINTMLINTMSNYNDLMEVEAISKALFVSLLVLHCIILHQLLNLTVI